MDPIHLPKNIGRQMRCALAGPIVIHVLTHRLNFISYECWFRRLMTTSLDGDWRVAVSTSESMKPVQRCLVKLHNQSRPQLEWTVFVLHVRADHLKRDGELSKAVLRLATRNLVWIAEKLRVLRVAMTIARHAAVQLPCSIFRSASATISRVIRSFSMCVLPYAKL